MGQNIWSTSKCENGCVRRLFWLPDVFRSNMWNCEWFAQADQADHLRWSPAVLLWPPCGWPADGTLCWLTPLTALLMIWFHRSLHPYHLSTLHVQMFPHQGAGELLLPVTLWQEGAAFLLDPCHGSTLLRASPSTPFIQQNSCCLKPHWTFLRQLEIENKLQTPLLLLCLSN